LKFSEFKEEQLALLLTHEMAHYLLDHQFLRVFKAFFVNHIYAKFIKRNAGFLELYDPTREEFKKKTSN
jgi:hypothetical protein